MSTLPSFSSSFGPDPEVEDDVLQFSEPVSPALAISYSRGYTATVLGACLFTTFVVICFKFFSS